MQSQIWKYSSHLWVNKADKFSYHWFPLPDNCGLRCIDIIHYRVFVLLVHHWEMFGICIVKLSPVWILLVVNNTTVSSGGKRWQLSNSFLTEHWCCCSLLHSLTFRGIFLLSGELCHAPRKWALCSFLFWADFLLGKDHCMTKYDVCGMRSRPLFWCVVVC